MPKFRPAFCALGKSDSGVTALEYALISALIAVAAISAIYGVGDRLEKNFDIVVAAISNASEPEDEPVPPGGGDTVADNNPQTPNSNPGGGTPDNEGGGGPGGGGSTPSIGETGTNPSSSGGGQFAGGGPSNQSAAVSAANGAGGANGGAGGPSGALAPLGGGTSAGTPGSDGSETTGDFGWDSTFRGDTTAMTGTTGFSETGFAMIGGGTAGTSAGNNPPAGSDAVGSGNSPTKSALILLMWLLLAICLAFLVWKVALEAAAKKDAKEELEDWKPAKFGA